MLLFGEHYSEHRFMLIDVGRGFTIKGISKFTEDVTLVLIVKTLLISIVDNDLLFLFNQEIGSSDCTAFF